MIAALLLFPALVQGPAWGAAAEGTAELTDDAGGVALFDGATPFLPGREMSACLQVQAGGAGRDDVVTLEARDVTGLLAPQLRIEVEVGSGGSHADCSGFAGVGVFDGTLADLAAVAATGGVATGWKPATAPVRTFRITAQLAGQTGQGQAAGATFVWRLDTRRPAPAPTPTGTPAPSGTPTGSPSTSPATTAPVPTDPGPTDPGPTDPGPTDPGPTDPGEPGDPGGPGDPGEPGDPGGPGTPDPGPAPGPTGDGTGPTPGPAPPDAAPSGPAAPGTTPGSPPPGSGGAPTSPGPGEESDAPDGLPASPGALPPPDPGAGPGAPAGEADVVLDNPVTKRVLTTAASIAREPLPVLGPALVMLLFLFLQHRIDRLDPKLSAASSSQRDLELEFPRWA